ncbi:hypothetical protein SLEP1_g54299 [Rubroshorea leprosula]|uniref:Uncharacterized protein n=1 Tax=Rubroshorea leprosula TaxID=152421 RepID=A0AAV5MFL5_9ROSI|nr:hypothetical protein SLEP1_g54299 [Rubroshorea leprosula]
MFSNSSLDCPLKICLQLCTQGTEGFLLYTFEGMTGFLLFSVSDEMRKSGGSFYKPKFAAELRKV